MFAALSKAISQITDPAFRGVLLRALAASIGLFVLAWIAAWFGLSWAGDWLAAWAGGEGFWAEVVEWLLGALGIAGVLFASFLLFPAVTGVVLSFLLDDIAAAVEQRHYPGLPAPRGQPLAEALRDALAFAGVTIGLNLLALPLYLLLLFVPPFNLFVFYGLNGYLLGREYFELVAVRRLPSNEGRQLRKRHRGRVFMAGVIVTFFLTLPLINLLTPIVATAFMVHIFEEARRRAGA